MASLYFLFGWVYMVGETSDWVSNEMTRHQYDCCQPSGSAGG
jgi:hypothetical protein